MEIKDRLYIEKVVENIDRISDFVKKNNNHIPWKDIKGLRNRLVHDYGNVILDFVYNTITMDLKILKEYFLNL